MREKKNGVVAETGEGKGGTGLFTHGYWVVMS